MLFVKVNSTGDQEWNCTFGGNNVDGAFSLVQTSNDSFVIAGSSTTEPVELFALNSYEFWILKIRDPSSIAETTIYPGIQLAFSLFVLIICKLNRRKRKKGIR
ncbi:MAG: hypothetical protein H7641_02395 [Candidatus Heimdallarchaeota archaeon]|nr:hypothetical protein [Candidatus Heimdallarchaeota archaeon]